MKHDAREAPGEPIDNGRNKARGQKGIASYSQLASRRVGKKLMMCTTDAGTTKPQPREGAV